MLSKEFLKRYHISSLLGIYVLVGCPKVDPLIIRTSFIFLMFIVISSKNKCYALLKYITCYVGLYMPEIGRMHLFGAGAGSAHKKAYCVSHHLLLECPRSILLEPYTQGAHTSLSLTPETDRPQSQSPICMWRPQPAGINYTILVPLLHGLYRWHKDLYGAGDDSPAVLFFCWWPVVIRPQGQSVFHGHTPPTTLHVPHMKEAPQPLEKL